MKYLIWIGFIWLISGCTVTQPYIYEYRIAPKIDVDDAKVTSCKTKSLKVAQVFGTPRLMSQTMRYTKGEYEEHSFTESKWSTTPATAISAAIVKSIRESHIFASVSSFRSRSRSDLVLESNIEEFIQHFSEDTNSSYVDVSMDMSLINSKNSKVIESKNFKRKIQLENLNAQAGVEGLNRALAEILEENNKWLSGVCK